MERIPQDAYKHIFRILKDARGVMLEYPMRHILIGVIVSSLRYKSVVLISDVVPKPDIWEAGLDALQDYYTPDPDGGSWYLIPPNDAQETPGPMTPIYREGDLVGGYKILTISFRYILLGRDDLEFPVVVGDEFSDH